MGGQSDWVMFTIVLFSVWKNMGYYMVIYLAGLQGINAELYEAASLDGAGAWQKFRYITWPQLQPTTFFVTIILTINCFKVYDIVYMLAGGSNGVINESAIVLVYHIYEEGIPQLKKIYGICKCSSHRSVPSGSGCHHYPVQRREEIRKLRRGKTERKTPTRKNHQGNPLYGTDFRLPFDACTVCMDAVFLPETG